VAEGGRARARSARLGWGLARHVASRRHSARATAAEGQQDALGKVANGGTLSARRQATLLSLLVHRAARRGLTVTGSTLEVGTCK
jgi:hypothetical protein